MNLVPLVQAVEVLMSPLQWGSRDAWLRECLQRVRDVRGAGSGPASAAREELEHLLRLPGDEPGWLGAALDSPGSGRRVSGLPPTAVASEALLPTISLRCALAAGLATLARLEAWRDTLAQAFDDVATGMAIYRTDGALAVTRNARWAELLAAEPARERLLDLIARQVKQVGAAPGGLSEEERVIEVDCESYRLVVSRAAAGTLLPESAVLVLMDRPSPGLPTTQELRITFGLRGREPQVALLAAAGLSNADIAERLRLSAHTVRHYLERVLDRLGLHTRKALAVHLMAGAGERPQPPERRASSRLGEADSRG